MTSALRQRTLELLRTHAARYPAWCVIDTYKLLYQACMGPAHATDDADALRKRLCTEYAAVETDPGMILLDDITLHTPLFRLHLAGAKAHGVDPHAVLEGFVACIRAFPPRIDLLHQGWALLCRQIQAGHLLVADPDGLDATERYLRGANFPAVSHSPAYRRTYAPAYRLVNKVTLFTCGAI
ncbi:hypothetical protein JXA88_07470 [Candidatus Fermentibacteria bacterium]|nr:hypothetical protein [Candidatus Fermentibacteria bacterium]